LGGLLSFLMVAPHALAQHTAKAIQDAAQLAGILRDGEKDLDAKLKTLVLAFDPASPLDVLQKIASMSRSVTLGANGRGDISVQQVCTFWESLKKDPNYTTSPDWKKFAGGHGRFLDYLLYNGTSRCGAGPLQSLIVQENAEGRWVWINFSHQVNFETPMGTYSTRGKLLRFRVSDKPEHAAPLISSYSTRGVNFHQLFKQINTNRVLQNPDAQEVATALTHVREGTLGNDHAKVIRTLSTYDVLSIQPVSSLDYLSYKPAAAKFQHFEMGGIAMISPHGLATKGDGAGEVPFKKGIAVVRTYEYNGRSSVDAHIGEVSMPPSKNKIAPEWKPVVEGTLESVNTTMENHFNAIQNSGIGLMYGPKSSYAKMSEDQRAQYIARFRKSRAVPPTPRETSCIGFVLNNLEKGYKNAGKSERWKEIDKIVRENSGDGNFLLRELKKDGWTTVYFNPDVKNPTTQVPSASKPPDHHVWTASEVKKGNNYLSGVKLPNGERFDGVPIDQMMTDYRPTNPYKNTPRTDELQKLQETPLFVGIANGGFHVYLGSQGNVIESHSTRDPTDPTNIEIRPFTEWGLLEGESYLSGVIAVPPGGWGPQK